MKVFILLLLGFIASCGGAGDDLDAGLDLDATDGSGQDDGDAGVADLDDGGQDPGDLDDGGQDDGGQDDGGLDDGGPDDGGLDDGGQQDAGADDGGVDPGAQLIIEQIDLTAFMGESALIVGPDGTSVIIDTGGIGDHADAILEAIDHHLPARRVDWVIVTHFHADHTGRFPALFAPAGSGEGTVEVVQGVVSRGLFDIDATFAADDGALQNYCNEIKRPIWDGWRHDLCAGPQQASCDGSGPGGPWPASDCDGLLKGDLSDANDDQQGLTSFIPLGQGARLYFTHANGWLVSNGGTLRAGDHGINIGHGGTGHENARSLGGVVSWGAFQHSFHGDLTGEVEAFVAAEESGIRTGPQGSPIISSGGLDVAHLSHHGLAGSTSQEWADWLFVDDGNQRNAVVGTNTGYWFSPSAVVADRIESGLGTGLVWVTSLGMMPGSHAKLKIANGAIVERVSSGGAAYSIAIRDANGMREELHFTSTP